MAIRYGQDGGATMIPSMIVTVLACATAPLAVREDPPQEAVNLIAVAVPVDCPHLIVDVVMSDQADITVACFSQGTQTYFSREEHPLFCESEGEPTHEILTLEFADDHTRLSSVQ